LRTVFQRIEKNKLFVKASKCALGAPEAVLTGHTIDREGKHFQREKLDKVLTMERPVHGRGLKSFLGLTNWFSEHIKDYAKIAKPLNAAISEYEVTKHLKIVWTDELNAAFEQLKEAVNNCPKLYFLQDAIDSEIWLETDASDYAIGAYLYQSYTEPGTRRKVTRPIGFMSKTLDKTEIKWSTYEKEGYAMVKAVKKWHHLLADKRFTIRTDHRNLTYLRDTGSPKVYGWKQELQAYDFDLEYVKGEENVAADAFSRLVKIDMNDVREAKGLSRKYPTQQLEQLSAIWEDFGCNNKLNDCDYLAALAEAQVEHVCGSEEFSTSIPDDAYNRIAAVHNSIAGHLGQQATYDALTNRGMFWPGMRGHVRQFLRQCPNCQKNSFNTAPVYTAPFTLSAREPMQTISIDTIGPIKPDEEGYQHILVIVDNFTRWTELAALKSVEAKEMAEHLVNYCGRFGFPAEILTDNGTQFVNDLMRELTALLGSRHRTTVAYSKEENSIVERMNKEVGRHLRAMVFDENSDVQWGKKMLPMVQRIINATKKKSTGFSPAQLLFGDALTLDRNVFVNPDVVKQTTQLTPRTMALGSKHFSDETGVVLSDTGKKVLRTQRELIALAQKHQLETDSHHMVERIPSAPLTEFPVGSYVMVKYAENGLRRGPVGGKTKPILHGPQLVITAQGSRYVVQNLVTLKEKPVHISRLVAYEYDKMRHDPLDAAIRDEHEFRVEKILKHRGDPKGPRKNLSFLVKWVGYNQPEDDSWEPWDNLKLVDKLHDYLIENRFPKALIPANRRK
jgi:hypothetical protein